MNGKFTNHIALQLTVLFWNIIRDLLCHGFMLQHPPVPLFILLLPILSLKVTENYLLIRHGCSVRRDKLTEFIRWSFLRTSSTTDSSIIYLSNWVWVTLLTIVRWSAILGITLVLFTWVLTLRTGHVVWVLLLFGTLPWIIVVFTIVLILRWWLLDNIRIGLWVRLLLLCFHDIQTKHTFP